MAPGFALVSVGLKKVKYLPPFFFALRKREALKIGSLLCAIPMGLSLLASRVDFYDSLFTSSTIYINVQSSLLDKLPQTLSEDCSRSCDGPITIQEAHKALIGMAHGKAPGKASGKAPGLDGFPMEFYVALWDVLGADLVEVLNASFQNGLLPSSQRGALILLIFKKGDRLLHKN